MWLLYIPLGEGDGTPSLSQQRILDQGTSIIGMATAADDKEVLRSLCIICLKLKVTFS